METILITGTSGFIGFHLAKKLLENGAKIIGFDSENDYYDVDLKISRRNILKTYENFIFYKGDLSNSEELEEVFKQHKIDKVCNLAAQAGVRYSIENPKAYIKSNLVGFQNIIQLAKEYTVKNFVYASSSSVYGKNEKQPFSVEDPVDNPISLYAATKKSNELIAHTYSHLFELPTTGLRFFTVQGPYGRPDMAYFKFTKSIFEGKPIDIYNHGKMERDFTDIDDIVDGVIKSLHTISKYEIFNLGNDTPTQLETMISLLEKHTGIKAKRNYVGMQDGDVKSTWADIEHTKKTLNWEPKIKIEDTIEKFVNWYKEYYKI
ncbi:SDR family NAD(P)-dependent oxidoreductase [Candidatus Gracilibacteria bacterium 28_42_T64]|nr:SDR family NAD(P)-dependent oxidoreductase [Candidatus Gracilibacteria bacterium 28_42_T64]